MSHERCGGGGFPVKGTQVRGPVQLRVLLVQGRARKPLLLEPSVRGNVEETRLGRSYEDMVAYYDQEHGTSETVSSSHLRQ